MSSPCRASITHNAGVEPDPVFARDLLEVSSRGGATIEICDGASGWLKPAPVDIRTVMSLLEVTPPMRRQST